MYRPASVEPASRHPGCLDCRLRLFRTDETAELTEDQARVEEEPQVVGGVVEGTLVQLWEPRARELSDGVVLAPQRREPHRPEPEAGGPVAVLVLVSVPLAARVHVEQLPCPVLGVVRKQPRVAVRPALVLPRRR